MEKSALRKGVWTILHTYTLEAALNAQHIIDTYKNIILKLNMW